MLPVCSPSRALPKSSQALFFVAMEAHAHAIGALAVEQPGQNTAGYSSPLLEWMVTICTRSASLQPHQRRIAACLADPASMCCSQISNGWMPTRRQLCCRQQFGQMQQIGQAPFAVVLAPAGAGRHRFGLGAGPVGQSRNMRVKPASRHN